MAGPAGRGRGALLGTGFCGALTTFSTFQIEAIELARDSGVASAAGYAAVTGAFALGLLTGLSVTGDALLVLGAGLLGSYTTFSTSMVEARGLGGRRMAVHLAGSMAAGLVSARAGWITAAGAAAAWG